MEIKCNGVSLSFGQFPVLQEVDFTLSETSRVGIVGQNGAGKSTLLKLLTGELVPDSGDIFITRGASLGFLKQNSGLQAANTVYAEMQTVFAELLQTGRELEQLERQMADTDPDGAQYAELAARYAQRTAAFEAGSGYDIDYRIRTVLFGMGFFEADFDKEIAKLSGGEKTRLALAKLLLGAPDVLLLDEPTNHLDLKTLFWLENYLQSYRGCIVVVSHDRYFLDAVVTEMLEVSRHRVRHYRGNYTQYKQQKEAETLTQQRAYEKQQKVIEKYQDYIDRNLVRASTSKMAKSRRKALDKIERVERPVEERQEIHFSFPFDRPPYEKVLTATGVDVEVEGKVLITGVDLTVKRGEKVCIVGENGAGKSTFLKEVLGLLPCKRGKIALGGFVKLGYFEQEQNPFYPQETVLAALHNKYPQMTELALRSHLARYGFVGEEIYKQVSELSGGELAKLKFANLSFQRPNFLVLDEPTNHLDVYTKEALQQALKEYEGTILMVSHDRYLLGDIADYIVELSRADGAQVTQGGFAAYRDKMLAGGAQTLQKARPKEDGGADESRGAASYRSSKQARRDAAQRRAKLAAAERDIEACERQIAALEEQLQQPEVQTNYQQLAELTTQLEQQKQLLEQHMEQWAELAE